MQASPLGSTKRKAQPTRVLRARPTGKKLGDVALLKRAMKRYPKTLSRLAK